MQLNKSLFNKSNSGAKFYISKKNGEFILNKSLNIEEKKRLNLSLNKQNFWVNKKLTEPFYSLKTNYSFNKKNFIIKMPFIHGISGDEILFENDLENINLFIKSIINLVIFFKNFKSDYKYIDKILFTNKLSSLRKYSNPRFNKHVIYLKKLIKKIPTKTKATNCHGDLTLSNMIAIKSMEKKKKFDKIYLIDWLETYAESYFQDLAKLKQDFYYGWSSRNLSPPQKINNLITGEYIWSKISKKFINKKNISLFKIYMILCLLRIIPYVKDESELVWIEESLNNEIIV